LNPRPLTYKVRALTTELRAAVVLVYAKAMIMVAIGPLMIGMTIALRVTMVVRAMPPGEYDMPLATLVAMAEEIWPKTTISDDEVEEVLRALGELDTQDREMAEVANAPRTFLFGSLYVDGNGTVFVKFERKVA
jgi:hypothetical protein